MNTEDNCYLSLLLMGMSTTMSILGCSSTIVGLVLFSIGNYTETATITVAIGAPLVILGYCLGIFSLIYFTDCCCKEISSGV